MVKSAQNSQDTIDIQIATLGQEVKTYTLASGSTVEDALNAAGMGTEVRVKVDGAEVNLDDVLENSDRLIVTSNVKGGAIA